MARLRIIVATQGLPDPASVAARPNRGIKPGNIVGAIANEAGLNGRSIGRIQIFDTHSTVDLPKGMPEDVFQGLRQLRVMNKPLQLSRFQG